MSELSTRNLNVGSRVLTWDVGEVRVEDGRGGTAHRTDVRVPQGPTTSGGVDTRTTRDTILTQRRNTDIVDCLRMSRKFWVEGETVWEVMWERTWGPTPPPTDPPRGR